MKPLSNQQLIEAYKDAVNLNLDEEFIHLLEQEIKSRNIYSKQITSR